MFWSDSIVLLTIAAGAYNTLKLRRRFIVNRCAKNRLVKTVVESAAIAQDSCVFTNVSTITSKLACHFEKTKRKYLMGRMIPIIPSLTNQNINIYYAAHVPDISPAAPLTEIKRKELTLEQEEGVNRQEIVGDEAFERIFVGSNKPILHVWFSKTAAIMFGALKKKLICGKEVYVTFCAAFQDSGDEYYFEDKVYIGLAVNQSA